MHLVLLYNSISGKGRAGEVADAFERRLNNAGHTTKRVATSNGTTNQALADALPSAQALVVLGGDGTLHSCADVAMQAGTPVYHVPLGTENLFAREFGMDRRFETLERAIEAGQTVDVDAATCNGRTFLLMLSVGPDASVIHRLAKVRRGTINHLSYARPILAEALEPATGPISVEVDGKLVVDARPGLLVVANCRQYALRIDPASGACMRDGLLDVVFFPGATRIDMLGWALTARLRTHLASKNLVYERGSQVRVTAGPRDLPVQLDGEAAGQIARGLELGVSPRRLRVLVPPTLN